MTLDELADEFMSARQSGGLVLNEDEVFECILRATRFYAAYGDIRSISGSDGLPGASWPADPDSPLPDPAQEPMVAPALPIKCLDLIDQDTVLTTGEWGIVSPLFSLYVEKENAIRLEASRGLGVDPYGRSSSEVASSIEVAEAQVIERSFQFAIITV